MKNTFFAFKQFVVHQENCAMKVTEDASIQGVWSNTHKAKQVLDIGSGTGLLSLLYAQKNNNVSITTVEIDEASYHQGKLNLQQGIDLFHMQLDARLGNIHQQKFEQQFDVILCNPPFYENHLATNNTAKNIAWHSNELTLEDVISISNLHISDNGILSILLPTFRLDELKKLCINEKLFIQKILFIKHNGNKQPHRIVAIISKLETTLQEECLIIRNIDNTYSNEMKSMMKEYYLNF
jgi:tRNA1Val (adenine37-N6)-methyltransferase